MCEELAHGGPQGLCVWVTLLFCEFDGAVAHVRSVTFAVLSVASVWLVVCVSERKGERQASVSLEESQSGRRPSPSIAENMSVSENMNLGWCVCGLLIEEHVCLWPLSGRGHDNRVPFAS